MSVHAVIAGLRLCLRPGVGWRISDVYSKAPSDPWDLREMLKLDPVRVRC